MIPNWFKKAYQDNGTKLVTAFLLIGGPIWSVLTYLVDNQSTSWWQAWVYMWGFYIFLIPIFYLFRNTK